MTFIRKFGFFLIALGFTLSSFANISHHQHYVPANNNASQGLSGSFEYLAPFTQLILSGKVDVILKMGSQPSIRVLNASTENLIINVQPVGDILSIDCSTIRIQSDGKKPKQIVRPLIEITVRQLNNLITKNSVRVRGQITSQSLIIQTKGSSQISLNGMVNVRQIQSTQKSLVNLYWVNSSNLVVEANKNSVVQLAGVAGVLHATLIDNAQLKGQYLRAQQAIVQTDNNAFAGVLAIQALRAFASQDSNIFYYKYPRSLNDFSLDSANILQVDWRP